MGSPCSTARRHHSTCAGACGVVSTRTDVAVSGPQPLGANPSPESQCSRGGFVGKITCTRTRARGPCLAEAGQSSALNWPPDTHDCCASSQSSPPCVLLRARVLQVKSPTRSAARLSFACSGVWLCACLVAGISRPTTRPTAVATPMGQSERLYTAVVNQNILY